MRKEPFETKDQFHLAIEKIVAELHAATMNYSLYHHLAKSTKKYPKAYSRGRLVWGIFTDALLSQTVLTLCRVYDDDHKTNSLKTIVRSRLNANSVDSVAEYLELIDRSDPVVKKLKDWRDHVLAHTNLNRILGRKMRPAMVPHHEELGALIDRAMNIVSHVGGSYVSRDIAEHYVPKQEADFVFESANEKAESIEAKIRDWLTQNGVNPDIFLEEDKEFQKWKTKNNLA